eukprot:scaffold2721_cov181-Ochromonas_danica.AAC.13
MESFQFRSLSTDAMETCFPATDNELVNSLSEHFFISGSIQMDNLPEVMEIIRVAFEDGGSTDEIIIEACQYMEFALIDFLLAVTSSDRPESAIASRCLAFASNIFDDLWVQYTAFHPRKLCNVLLACKVVPKKVRQLATLNTPVKRRSSYLGYDPRDKRDFNVEGYDEEDARYEQEIAFKAGIEDSIMVYLLLLSQFFYKHQEDITIHIANSRDLSSRSTPSVEENYELKMSELVNMEDCIDQLVVDRSLLDRYCSDILLYLVQTMLSIACSTFEDATQHCVKIVSAINDQFPPLSADRPTTEVARFFIQADKQPNAEGKLTKTLLYILNENGYPNMIEGEALAACKMCIHLLGQSAPIERLASNQQKQKGHFYANDIKFIDNHDAHEACRAQANGLLNEYDTYSCCNRQLLANKKMLVFSVSDPRHDFVVGNVTADFILGMIDEVRGTATIAFSIGCSWIDKRFAMPLFWKNYHASSIQLTFIATNQSIVLFTPQLRYLDAKEVVCVDEDLTLSNKNMFLYKAACTITIIQTTLEFNQYPDDLQSLRLRVYAYPYDNTTALMAIYNGVAFSTDEEGNPTFPQNQLWAYHSSSADVYNSQGSSSATSIATFEINVQRKGAGIVLRLVVPMFLVLVLVVVIHQMYTTLQDKQDRWPLRQVYLRILECFGRTVLLPFIVCYFLYIMPSAFGTYSSRLHIRKAIVGVVLALSSIIFLREAAGLYAAWVHALELLIAKVNAKETTVHDLSWIECLVVNIWKFEVISVSPQFLIFVLQHREEVDLGFKRRLSLRQESFLLEKRKSVRFSGSPDSGFDIEGDLRKFSLETTQDDAVLSNEAEDKPRLRSGNEPNKVGGPSIEEV